MIRFTLALLFALQIGAATYPLEPSSNNRYVVDQNGDAHLFNSMTLWHIIVNISDADAATLMDTIVALGYNAIQTRLIDNWFQGDSQDNSNPPPENFYGESPFTGSYTFDSLNDDYFTRAKARVDLAATKGLTMLIHFCYAGFEGSQGFGDVMELTDQADLEAYATYVGNFFENSPNIVWVNDGDYTPPGVLATKMNAMATALLAADPNHIITAHVSPTARDHFNGQAWLNMDSIYANRAALEGHANWQLSPARPIHFLDSAYEGDSNSFSEQQMRGQAYQGLFGGAIVGFNYGHTIVSEGRTGWRDELDTAPTLDRIHAYNLARSREFWKFVPDFGDAVTSSKGDINTQSYTATCRASDGRTVMIYYYAAVSRTVTMTQIAGTTARAWWFNPADGTAELIGTFPTTGTQAFNSTGEGNGGEAVLVIDEDGAFENEPGDPIVEEGPSTVMRVGTLRGAATLR